MEKKNIVLISLVSLLVIALIVMAVIVLNKDEAVNKPEENSVYEPVFLSTEEKKERGISTDIKAQAFYDDEGNLIYKKIESDDDIVWNPEKLDN